MSSTNDERRAELIAAALADDLTSAEAAEFDALRAVDPTIDAEFAELRDIAGSLNARPPALTPWSDASPGPELRARIHETGAESAATAVAPVHLIALGGRARRPRATRPRSRSIGVLVTAGAACLAVGLALGIVLPGALSAPPSGPPGTLGAIESIDLTGEPDGMQIEAEIVAHSWGTEAVLDAEGLDAGVTYSIVMLGADGEEFTAGAMLGSDAAIHCRVNAAVLRESVVRVEIRDADDVTVAAASLPSL